MKVLIGFGIFFLLLSGNATADVVLSFSSSGTTYSEITSLSIAEGTTATNNKVFVWATDPGFATHNGLQSWGIFINPAGSIANSGSAANLGFSNSWVGSNYNLTKDYDTISNIGLMEVYGNSGVGVSSDVNNRIYLGYFGLNAINVGTANLQIEAEDPSLLWAYGDSSPGTPSRPTVDPLFSTLNVTVVAVPEPGTLLLGGIAAIIGGAGVWRKRLHRLIHGKAPSPPLDEPHVVDPENGTSALDL